MVFSGLGQSLRLAQSLWLAVLGWPARPFNIKTGPARARLPADPFDLKPNFPLIGGEEYG